MKTTLIALAAALAFSAVPAAYAQDNVAKVNVSKPVYVSADQFNNYAHAYRLSNGQVVKFVQAGNAFFTQVDKSKPIRMTAVSDSEFVTAQGTRIAFREYGDEVGITNFEKLPMAQVLPANTIVIARR